MGPVLVVVVQARERGMCIGGLGQHHLPWKKSRKHNLEAPDLRRGWAVHLTTQLKEQMGKACPSSLGHSVDPGKGQGF